MTAYPWYAIFGVFSNDVLGAIDEPFGSLGLATMAATGRPLFKSFVVWRLFEAQLRYKMRAQG
ncbi:hypothetical protein B1F69_21375 [Pseudomonas syringae]|nr:hypothetical protein B1F69_21375 [Pseudomonas syringae]